MWSSNYMYSYQTGWYSKKTDFPLFKELLLFFTRACFYKSKQIIETIVVPIKMFINLAIFSIGENNL